MKLCKDCNYFQGPMAAVECAAPGNLQTDFVNGGTRPKQASAQVLRMSEGIYCGPEAKWFAERVPERSAA